MIKRIGITGGIGSGKSVVSDILRQMGYDVYDSDLEAQRVMCTDSHIISSLKNRFGENIYVNDSIDRPLLAKKIFNDKDNLAFVNGIVHPAVCADFLKWSKPKSVSFIESAILFEAKLDDYVDKIIYVDAPLEIRVRRTIKRDDTTAEQVMSRIKNQQLITEYALKRSDYIINNTGTMENLKVQISDVIKQLFPSSL